MSKFLFVVIIVVSSVVAQATTNSPAEYVPKMIQVGVNGTNAVYQDCCELSAGLYVAITGIYADYTIGIVGKVMVRGIRGYYNPTRVEIIALASDEEKKRFTVTYRDKLFRSIIVQNINFQGEIMAPYAIWKAKKSYFGTKISNNPAVIFDGPGNYLSFGEINE